MGQLEWCPSTSLRYAQDERFCQTLPGRMVLETLRTNGSGNANRTNGSGNANRTNGSGNAQDEWFCQRPGRMVLPTPRTNGSANAQDEWFCQRPGRMVLETPRTNGSGNAQDEWFWKRPGRTVLPTPRTNGSGKRPDQWFRKRSGRRVFGTAQYDRFSENFTVRPEPFDKAQDRRSEAKSKDAVFHPNPVRRISFSVAASAPSSPISARVSPSRR